MTVLNTDRLVMRPWRDEDYPPFAALNADPRVMEFMPECLPEEGSIWVANRFRAYLDDKGFGLWALEEKRSGAFIGFTGIQEPRFEAHFTPCIEIGWRLAYEYWGKGYATEAALAAARHGFDELALQEIVSFTARDNLRSRRVMAKLGMRYDEEFVHPSVEADSPLNPHVLYRLGREEFYAHTAA